MPSTASSPNNATRSTNGARLALVNSPLRSPSPSITGVFISGKRSKLGLTQGGETVSPPSVRTEVPHGPVVESPMDRRFAVSPINPKQLDRFRDRFSPAGAKDDRARRPRPPLAQPSE